MCCWSLLLLLLLTVLRVVVVDVVVVEVAHGVGRLPQVPEANEDEKPRPDDLRGSNVGVEDRPSGTDGNLV